MTVPAIAAIESRIRGIESRFPAPAGFQRALDAAAATADEPIALGPHAAGAEVAEALSFGTAPVPTASLLTPAFGSAQVAAPLVAPPASWTDALPEAGHRWASLIESTARRHDLDPALLAALVWQESGFDPAATSHAGALGLTQLMPATAAGLGVDPHDPIQNLEGGARYLREQLDRFGRVDHALAAYNAGPGRVLDAGGIPAIRETQDYVVRVTDYHARLGGRP